MDEGLYNHFKLQGTRMASEAQQTSIILRMIMFCKKITNPSEAAGRVPCTLCTLKWRKHYIITIMYNVHLY